MSLNEQRGNMYEFVTHTWNPLGGFCEHQCKYCYMRAMSLKKYQGEPRLAIERGENLGHGNHIFVGSATDIFAKGVNSEIIKAMLDYCAKYRLNKYLFQSKNPLRFSEFESELSKLDCYLATTIETNRSYDISNAPHVQVRAEAMGQITKFKKMVTIEPVFDFDCNELVKLIRTANPQIVTIGANTSNFRDFPEPTSQKLNNLINILRQFGFEVRPKHNIKRILG